MVKYYWALSTTFTQEKELQQLFLAALLPQKRSSEAQLSHYFNTKILPRLKKPQLLHIAYNQDIIVGFSIFEKWKEHEYYLAEMAVLPTYQSQGIGKQLAFSILEKDLSTEKILLVTEQRNHWAQSFYKKIGFTASSFQHPDYPKNFVGYEFRLTQPN